MNPNTQAFLITIVPYLHAVAPASEKDVHFIYGWSESVLRYIALKINGGASQTEEIEGMRLEATSNQNVTSNEDGADPD